MMDNDDVNYADVLLQLWGERAASLSVAVWWIATGGSPTPCDDDKLERAAKDLIGAALDGRIAIFGQNKDGDTLAIPSEKFGKTLKVASFTGDSGDATLFFKGAVLRWQFDIADEVFSDEEGDGDTIDDRDIVLWRRMFVRKADLERIWPSATAHDNEGEAQPGDALMEDGTQKRNLPDAVAQCLRKLFPSRPPMKRKELSIAIRKANPELGDFGMTVLSEAIKIAYGNSVK
jgi:hypothetical protein